MIREAEGWTDHRLFRAKVNFVVEPKAMANSDKLLKQVDANKLKVPLVHNEFMNEMYNLPCIENWKGFKDSIDEVCYNILGLTEEMHQHWFNDNDEEINLLFEEKRKTFNIAGVVVR